MNQSSSLDALINSKRPLEYCSERSETRCMQFPSHSVNVKIPPNAYNYGKQVRLYFTKKSREPRNLAIRKPTPTEAAGAKDLNKIEFSVCGVCDDKDSEALPG